MEQVEGGPEAFQNNLALQNNGVLRYPSNRRDDGGTFTFNLQGGAGQRRVNIFRASTNNTRLALGLTGDDMDFTVRTPGLASMQNYLQNNNIPPNAPPEPGDPPYYAKIEGRTNIATGRNGLQTRAHLLFGPIHSHFRFFLRFVLNIMQRSSNINDNPFFTPGRTMFFHLTLYGVMLRPPANNPLAVPEVIQLNASHSLPTVRIGPLQFNGNIFDRLGQSQTFQNYLRQSFDQVNDHFSNLNAGGDGAYFTYFLCNSITLTFFRVVLANQAFPEGGPPLLAACNSNKTNVSKAVYTVRFGNQLLHCFSPNVNNNNCFFYPLLFHQFKQIYHDEKGKNKFNVFLNDKKISFLRDVLGIENPPEDWAPDIRDVDVLVKLAGHFKVHLVIFTEIFGSVDSNGSRTLTLPDKGFQKIRQVGLYLDTRKFTYSNNDPENVRSFWKSDHLAQTMSFENFDYVSVVVGRLPRKSVTLPNDQVHCYPIVSDQGSVLCKYRGFCPSCRNSFTIDAWTGKIRHQCNEKIGIYNSKMFSVYHNLQGSQGLYDLKSDTKVLEDPDNGKQVTVRLCHEGHFYPAKGKKTFPRCKYTEKEHLLFFDFETIFPKRLLEEAVVYAAGFYQVWDGTYRDFYGRGCMDEVLAYLESLDFGVKLVAYNGARFDFLIILRKIMTTNCNLFCDQFMLNKGELLNFRILHRYKKEVEHNFCDPIKYNPASLAKACKSFNIPVQKTTFPHSFLEDWEGVEYVGPLPDERYFPAGSKEWIENWRRDHPDGIYDLKQECLKYLKLDVMSLYELFKVEEKTFADIFRPIGAEHFDLAHFFSTSQIAHEVFQHFLIKRGGIVLYPPPDMTAFDYYKNPYMGGLVSMMNRFYRTRKFPEMIKHLAEGEPLKAYNCIEDDYAVYLDVCSLYPTVMEQSYFPYGMPVWIADNVIDHLNRNLCFNGEGDPAQIDANVLGFFGEWEKFYSNPLVNQPHEILQDHFTCQEWSYRSQAERMLCSIWYVTWSPDPDNRLPFHMTKTRSGKIQSTNEPFQTQFFYSGDIFGLFYIHNKNLPPGRTPNRIHKIRSISTWASVSRLFKETIQVCKQIKDQGTAENNPVKRTLGKNLCNQGYGKHGQNPVITSVNVCNSLKDVARFYAENVVKESTPFERRGEGREEDSDVYLMQGIRRMSSIVPQKCTFLAGFVTSYARLYMLRNVFDRILKSPLPESDREIIYTDTDSCIITKAAMDTAIDRRLLVLPGSNTVDLFGQLKDDIAKESPEYAELKTTDPIKIIKVYVITKKVYAVHFMLPNGKICSYSKCKGIQEDVDKQFYDEATFNPTSGRKECFQEFSVTKTLKPTNSSTMKRKAELYLESVERKKKRVSSDPHLTEEQKEIMLRDVSISQEDVAKIVAIDDYQNTGFFLGKDAHKSRTFNKTPSTFRYYDIPERDDGVISTIKLYPFGHPYVTPDRRKSFFDRLGVDDVKEEPLRWGYRPPEEINLTYDVIRDIEEQDLEKEGNDVLRESGSLQLHFQDDGDAQEGGDLYYDSDDDDPGYLDLLCHFDGEIDRSDD